MIRKLLYASALVVMTMTVQADEDISSAAKKILEQPKEYVGVDVCRSCHLEHNDAWAKTLHSKMLVDAKANPDAVVVDIIPEQVLADLKTIESKLKIPAADVYIPSQDEVLYTIGSQWKQRYIIKKDGVLFISPIQFNIDTGRWVNYHEADWQERPWLTKCGGCHATGVDLEEQTFVDEGVTCEACHGPGSHHAALPRTAIYAKRDTITNPAKLTGGIAVQVCGSCHTRGHATDDSGAGWPVGYVPGKALSSFYEEVSIAAGNAKYFYDNEYSKSHHQQYLDWKKSSHADAGVTCVSCHSVHDLSANLVARGQTSEKGDKQCIGCHEQTSQTGAHKVHSFGNCISCHMPKIAKSAEAGDIRSHVFDVLEPQDSIDNPGTPNSCQTCHEHKDQDIYELNELYQAIKER